MASYLDEADVNETDMPGAYRGDEQCDDLVGNKRSAHPEDV